MKKIFLIFLITLASFAQEYSIEDAIKMSKDPVQREKAAEILWKMSLEGESRAMTQLGKLFIYGRGVPKNCRKGVYFLFNALTEEENRTPDPEAMKELALLFQRGICVEKNHKKFVKYMKKYEKMKSLLKTK